VSAAFFGAELYRFLKQARQRASRRFLKDGARSSLPQYRQTTFSAPDVDRDDRGESVEAFARRAAFGAAPTAFFFAGAADLPFRPTDTSGADLDSVFTLKSPSRARAWCPRRREHALLCRRDGGSDSLH
jgi:hypothetical protein